LAAPPPRIATRAVSLNVNDESGGAGVGTGQAGAGETAGAISVRMVGLMALAMFINYADRGSLSVVAPALKDQLHVDDAGMGVLLSSFFWSYTLCQPLAGSIVQRFDVRWVLAAGLTLWAGATMACGLAGSFAALLALRLIMGVGESVIYPANARILAERAREHLRGRCNGLISMAQSLGPTAGTLLGGLILAQFGWRAVFLSLGAVSLGWLLPWLTTPMGGAGRPRSGGARATPGPGYGELLRQRALWGVSIGQFCYSWQFYLLLTWLPTFLVKAQHQTFAAMAVIGAAVYASQALAAVSSGVVTDLLIRRGGSASVVRKAGILISGAGCGAALLLVGVGPHELAVPMLLVAGIFTGLGNPMMFSIGQTLAGPAAGGRWMGIQNMVGNCAGILAPAATGMIVQATGSFTSAFAFAAALSVAGLFCWGVVLPHVQPVLWRAGAGLGPAKPAV
jgi:MFS family permease